MFLISLFDACGTFIDNYDTFAVLLEIESY